LEEVTAKENYAKFKKVALDEFDKIFSNKSMTSQKMMTPQKLDGDIPESDDSDQEDTGNLKAMNQS
jgi:hypothetical protein